VAQLEFFLVAESCVVDAMTNRMSIFHVLEVLYFASFPASIANLAAVAVWNPEPGDSERDFQASLLAHKPGEAKPERYDVNFRLSEARARTLVHLENYALEQPGTLRFELLLNGEHRASHSVTVAVGSQADVGSAPAL
jgi:hypothetical protein